MLFILSIERSMFFDWSKRPFLHLSSSFIKFWTLLFTCIIFSDSAMSCSFYSRLMSSIWFIVWLSKLGWGCSFILTSSSEDEAISSSPFFFLVRLLVISSFLYLLIVLNLLYSLKSSFSNTPVTCSQAQNMYFTMFGKERSMMLLNRLFIKLFRSTP